jgi:hypothetical protein
MKEVVSSWILHTEYLHGFYRLHNITAGYNELGDELSDSTHGWRISWLGYRLLSSQDVVLLWSVDLVNNAKVVKTMRLQWTRLASRIVA